MANKWTVMVYFSADNSVTDYITKDLMEMKQAGSSNEVAILAQADLTGGGATSRYYLRPYPETLLDEDKLFGSGFDPAVLRTKAMGDPQTLIDFVTWCKTHHEADKYMLVIWGHGQGWQTRKSTATEATASPGMKRPDEVFVGNTEAALMVLRADTPEADEVRISLPARIDWQWLQNRLAAPDLNLQLKDLQSARFVPNVLQTIVATEDPQHFSGLSGQPIALRSGSPQSAGGGGVTPKPLMQEIAEILHPSPATNPKIDILGLDACLMAMAEVGYNLRNDVSYLVASEDVLPLESWPYHTILAKLVAKCRAGTVSEECLARDIVAKNIFYYHDQHRYTTMSALNLAKADTFAGALKSLVEQLVGLLAETNTTTRETNRARILQARALTQSYYVRDYIDLYDFCRNLSALFMTTSPPAICTACNGVIKAISGEDRQVNGILNSLTLSENRLVTAYGYYGYPVRDSHGVSIFFPANLLRASGEEPLFSTYSAQPLVTAVSAGGTGWAGFLSALLGPRTEIWEPERPVGKNEIFKLINGVPVNNKSDIGDPGWTSSQC